MKLILLFLIGTSIFGLKAQEPTLSFDAALKMIVERSTSVGIEQANLEGTRARNLPQHLSLLPAISVVANQTQSHSLGYSDSSKRGVGVQAEFNILRFGSDFAGMRAANREEEAQAYTVSDTILKAEEAGVSLLVGIIQNGKTVDILTQIVQMRTEALRVAIERFERGLIARQESDKFSVDLDNSRAQLREAEIEWVRSKSNLKVQMGSEFISYDWPWKKRLSEIGLGPLAESKAELSRRPDWMAASQLAEAKRSRATQNLGAIFPSVDLNVSYGTYRILQPSPQLEGAEWVGMATISFPIFDRLKNYGNYQAAVQARTAAELDLERVKRNAESEFASAKKTLAISLESAKAREQTLAVSRRLYVSNLQRYKRAIVNANELMNDQDRLYQSELLAIKGWADVHSYFTKLCHVYGKRITECLAR